MLPLQRSGPDVCFLFQCFMMDLHKWKCVTNVAYFVWMTESWLRSILTLFVPFLIIAPKKSSSLLSSERLDRASPELWPEQSEYPQFLISKLWSDDAVFGTHAQAILWFFPVPGVAAFAASLSVSLTVCNSSVMPRSLHHFDSCCRRQIQVRQNGCLTWTKRTRKWYKVVVTFLSWSCGMTDLTPAVILARVPFFVLCRVCQFATCSACWESERIVQSGLSAGTGGKQVSPFPLISEVNLCFI